MEIVLPWEHFFLGIWGFVLFCFPPAPDSHNGLLLSPLKAQVPDYTLIGWGLGEDDWV